MVSSSCLSEVMADLDKPIRNNSPAICGTMFDPAAYTSINSSTNSVLY